MLGNAKSKFSRFVKSKKINVFGAFFILSFLMLVIIKLSENYDETLTYKLSYINLPENEVFKFEEEPTVEVGVSGFGFYLFKEYFKKRRLVIDFESDVYKGSSTYTLLTEKHKDEIEGQIGGGLDLNFIRPDTVRFPYEVLDVKRVPIKLRAKIAYSAGYDSLFGLEMEPDSINIIGSNETLKTIDSVETALLDRKEVNDDINQTLGLISPKSTGVLKLSQDAIIVSADVSKFTEGNFDIPINLVNVPNNLKINYFPKQISVSFQTSLSHFKSVKQEDFEIKCDYKNILNSESTYLIPELIKRPDSVKNVKMRQKKVEYIVNQ